jgi:hypothetical protein
MQTLMLGWLLAVEFELVWPRNMPPHPMFVMAARVAHRNVAGCRVPLVTQRSAHTSHGRTALGTWGLVCIAWGAPVAGTI